jgi:tetratricopeptide (TPR) repeat protein
MNWIAPESRQANKPADKQRFLVEWLLKWKLFSEEAQKFGYQKRVDVVKITEWAYKFTTAFNYINTNIIVRYKSAVKIDTSLCYYEYWDRSSVAPGIKPDSASLREIVASDRDSKAQVVFDEYIYQLRTKAGVNFLAGEYVDGKIKDPKEMAKTADSLFAAGTSKDAEKIYRELVDNFPFTTYGQNALVELAKILTENESYSDAVSNYRRYLLLSSEPDRQCNIFFMIGFVYGEYLSRPEIAEAHYKWILKNAPACELADDAEFMYLHLDEPMIGVDELQGEAKRQGKSDAEANQATKS